MIVCVCVYEIRCPDSINRTFCFLICHLEVKGKVCKVFLVCNSTAHVCVSPTCKEYNLELISHRETTRVMKNVPYCGTDVNLINSKMWAHINDDCRRGSWAHAVISEDSHSVQALIQRFLQILWHVVKQIEVLKKSANPYSLKVFYLHFTPHPFF